MEISLSTGHVVVSLKVEKNPNGTVRYGDFLSKFHSHPATPVPAQSGRQSAMAMWNVGLPKYGLLSVTY